MGTMHTSELLKHIYDINLSYLLLAQRLIVQDKASAMFRLGISEEMANTLAAADGNIAADLNSPPVLPVRVRLSFTKHVVSEHYAVADKAIASNRDIFANKRMGLNFCVCANLCIALYFDKRSDENIVAKLAVVQVCGLINHHIFTAGDVADGSVF